MNVSLEIKRLREEITRTTVDLRSRIKWLRAHRKQLQKLPEGRFCGERLDFDRLPHDEVIKVIRTLGGKWKKDKNDHAEHGKTKIDYQSNIGGRTVMCWGGDPPPSCRLVEVEEHVPEQVIPAHTRKVTKMICTGHGDPLVEAIAMAQPKPAQQQQQ